MTAQFVDRLFQEYTTYNGEIDYKLYLDFVLAKENPKHVTVPPACSYLEDP